MTIRTKKQLINKIGKIIAIIGLIVASIFIFYLFNLNILPLKYIYILLVVIIFIYTIMYLFILNKKIKIPIKIVANIVILIFTIIFVFGTVYIDRTILFLNRISNRFEQTEEYYLMVLETSNYKDTKHLNNKKIGFYSTESTRNIQKAIETLTQRISFKEKKYDDIISLFEGLQNQETDAILINSSLKTIMKEDYDYIHKLIKEIDIVLVPIETNDIVKIVDVTNTPFNVFLVGSDSYGSIGKVSNSDVNMLITVNPKINQILLTSIPRDYYVELYNTNGGMDKLTHAGYYGIETSVKTVENLLDTEINYYAKVNFTTVIDIVNLIGGIEVNSEYSFCDSGHVGCYKKGYNKLNGKQALAFARERYSFSGGDRVRGQHQQKVIAAIIDKVTSSPALIAKYNSILSAVEKSFQTNLDNKSITKLVKLQLNKMPSWDFINQSLDGSDFHVKKTYSLAPGSKPYYVMKPYEESIASAQKQISETLNAK